MALSRIWAAFIIVAILAATIQSLFTENNRDIYSRMVVGKAGDTSLTRTIDSASVPLEVRLALDTLKEVKAKEFKFVKGTGGDVIHYREQNADGVIATCWNAVEI